MDEIIEISSTSIEPVDLTQDDENAIIINQMIIQIP